LRPAVRLRPQQRAEGLPDLCVQNFAAMDLVSGAPGVRHAASWRLSQAMRLAVERQTGIGDCVAHELRVAHQLSEAVDGERPSILGIDNGDMIARRSSQNHLRLAV
jgi:hypothetical protein